MIAQKENIAVLNQLLPLGGIGAGYLLLDGVGHLSCHIPVTSFQGHRLVNSAPYIRVATSSGGCYLRCLRGCAPDEEAKNEGGPPPCLMPSGYQNHFHYPNASFQLLDSEAPVEVTWTYFNPVIPYDHVAAVMPVVIMGIRVYNTSSEACEVSALQVFDTISSFENREAAPESGMIYTVRVPSDLEQEGNFSRVESRGNASGPMSGTLRGYEANGLVFGERRKLPGRKLFPHACLAAKKRPGAEIRVSVFDPENPEERTRFWDAFCRRGEVPGLPEASAAQIGAVCISAVLEPGASHRFEFAFAWHVPEEWETSGQFGNAGLRSFKSAQDTVYYALRHIDYMVAAVEKWQRRLLSPRLPADFGRAMVEAAGAFTSHTRHTPSGAVVFVRDTEPPGNTEALPWDFFSAMALLTFAPHFHTLSVTHALNAALAGRKAPDFLETPDTVCEAAMLALSAYADVIFLGHRARMAEWLPQLGDLFSVIVGCEAGDLPAVKEALPKFSLKGLGLWSAALDALARMNLESGDRISARNHRQACAAMYQRYERRLLEIGASVNGGENAPAPVISLKDLPALAGPCFSRFLGMEPSTVMQGIVTLLTAELDMTSGKGGRIPLCDFAVRALARLLYKGRGGGAVPEIKTLFASLQHNDTGSGYEPRSPQTLPGPATLARWIALHAASGFSYDALRQVVTLRLPQDLIRILKFPILSPLSLGIIIFRRVAEDEGLILLRFCVETPLTIAEVLLHLPKPTILESVSCIRNGETIMVRHETGAENNNTLIKLTFKTVQKMVNTFTMRLRELPETQE